MTKYYNERLGVEDVSFSVRKGEVFGYLGPNGAGKTTTIRLLLGLLRPTRGRALVLGVDSRDDSRMAEIKARLGFLPEEFGFPRGLRGREIVKHFANIRGGAPRLDELLSLFPLDLNKRIEEYSKGMRQTLLIILTFMHDPEVVILDEPTTGLDPLMRDRFLTFLKNEVQKGKTVFLSSHVLSEVQKVADRVCLIKGGKIIALESLNSILSKSGKIIKALLREPLSPRKLEGEVGVVKVRVLGDGREVEMIVRSGYSQVLEVLAEHHIEDIEVRNITLEELFLHFYER
ncbi:MAG: ABC transporter ATP-binding protein [Acidilobaceae archaeon]